MSTLSESTASLFPAQVSGHCRCYEQVFLRIRGHPRSVCCVWGQREAKEVCSTQRTRQSDTCPGKKALMGRGGDCPRKATQVVISCFLKNLPILEFLIGNESILYTFTLFQQAEGAVGVLISIFSPCSQCVSLL